jgi:carboxyl-terminal processing protease
MFNNNKWLPLLMATCVAAGIWLGIWLKPAQLNTKLFSSQGGKLQEVFSLLNSVYVDTIDTRSIEEKTINDMLTALDPHSVYMSIDDLKIANEQLEGSFEGIGVEFSILEDTITVISPIEGGPSYELGIQSGDKIVYVDTQLVAGVSITNEQVFKLLRGPKGTEVKVKIARHGSKQLIPYHILRNTIPVKSIDASFMLDNKTGYIRVSRFAIDTYREFANALKKLNATPGFSRLVVDLRGNPGGYLDAVVKMVDEVLPDKKLITYTKGRKQPRHDYNASKKGIFEQGKLCVLIDESSASASEIFAGAIQDHDRGTIIGRRSFGKGLVQEQFKLKDGSGLRLTVSRYYIPSGRSIQKPYNKGSVAYEHEIYNRYENGEVNDVNRSHIEDTLAYFTASGRKVFGGGGIMPDIFIPIDTTYRNVDVYEIMSRNLVRQFAALYVSQNRKKLLSYKTVAVFDRQHKEALYPLLIKYTQTQGINVSSSHQLQLAAPYLEKQAKAAIARLLWNADGYYYILSIKDPAISKAIEVMNKS